MSALLLHPGPVPVETLRAALARALPGLPVRLWPDCGDVDEIDVALVSRIPDGALARLPKLRMVASLHAGIDHLLRDAALSPAIPITRPVSAHGDALMNEYILAQVLHHHRDMPAYAQAQAEARWIRREILPVSQRRVGFLGLGAVGLPAAQLLARVGFDVAGWARRERAGGEFAVFHGEQGLRALVERSQILVNLLPLTPQTENIIDAHLLSWLPEGAAVINVGRGQHVVDAALMAALDGGRLAGATLDVFRTEPLPSDDPLWRHPGITITPHASRRVSVDEVVTLLAANFARLQAGLPLLHTVDRSAGY